MQEEEFISAVERRTGLDSDDAAYAATDATLTVLGQRLTEGEAENIASQLPTRLDETLTGESAEAEGFSVEEFVERVFEREREQTGSSVADTDEAERHIRGVTSVLGNAVSGSELDDARDSFLATFESAFEGQEDVRPAEELFHVVDVGDPSESETRRLYHEADRAAYVLTKSFEYLDAVSPSLAAAIDRGVAVRALFYHPDLLDEGERRIQESVTERLREEFPAVEFRFSTGELPWRGTFVDPSTTYDDGEAIFLVEEPEVPDHMRQAALTANGSFVAGFKRYFELVWDHESVATS